MESMTCPQCQKEIPRYNMYGHLKVKHELDSGAIRLLYGLEDESQFNEIQEDGYLPFLIDNPPWRAFKWVNLIVVVVALIAAWYSLKIAFVILVLFTGASVAVSLMLVGAAQRDIEKNTARIEQLRERIIDLETS